MRSFDRFERNLPDLLEALAAPRRPDYAEELFARTVASRQRPGWTFPERWLPVSALTRSLAGVPRVPWRIGALVALLAVAAVAAVLVAGALLNRTPPPYGPASNGRIAYVDGTGRLVTGDLSTGTSKVVVAQPGSGSPIYSQDGRRIAFLRPSTTSAAMSNLVVVDADGSNLTQLDLNGIINPQYIAWSGRGDQILVLDAASRMLLFDTLRSGDPVALSDQLGLGQVDIGPGGYNFRSSAAFRPPLGDEILFVASAGTGTLMAVKPDGTGLRTLLVTTTSVPYIRVRAAEWSPDGTQVVVLLSLPSTPEQSRAYVLNADGTGLHPLSSLSVDPIGDQNSPRWSPDGTRIAFQYWLRHTDGTMEDFNPIGIVDVATSAPHRGVGQTFPNGFTSWEWSPDGKSILEVPGDGSGDILIVDAATGETTTAPWTATQPISWQRVVH
jgi:WD40-like Beta Propeller Repeat